MSERFQAMLDKMTPEDRKAFVEMMKNDNNFFFADSLEDIVAILGQIQETKKLH